jgi:hypothetical protein
VKSEAGVRGLFRDQIDEAMPGFGRELPQVVEDRLLGRAVGIVEERFQFVGQIGLAGEAERLADIATGEAGGADDGGGRQAGAIALAQQAGEGGAGDPEQPGDRVGRPQHAQRIFDEIDHGHDGATVHKAAADRLETRERQLSDQRVGSIARDGADFACHTTSQPGTAVLFDPM